MTEGTIRNSAKAIIVKDGKVLFTKCQFDPNEEIYSYILPGGGQHKGETLQEAVVREVLEETGAEVAVCDLSFVREYIEADSLWGDIHQVEFYFTCEMLTGTNQKLASEIDAQQVGLAWLEVGEFENYQIIPEKLKECFTSEGRTQGATYIGKC